MVEWPEEIYLEYSNVVRHWQDVDPDDVFTRDARPYVPKAYLTAALQKLEEVQKELESLRGELARLLGPRKPRKGVTPNEQWIAAVGEVLGKLEEVERERDDAQEKAEELCAQAEAAVGAISEAETVLTGFSSEELEPLGLTVGDEVVNAGAILTNVLAVLRGIEPGMLAAAELRADQLQATLDALVGEEAVEAIEDAARLNEVNVLNWTKDGIANDAHVAPALARCRERSEILRNHLAALQAAKKQAGGGGE